MVQHARQQLPLWLKILYTAFLLVLVPVYTVHYGPGNFLWFSDIALFGALIVLWTGYRLVAGMMAVAVLVPELAWNIGFFWRLMTGQRLFGLTDYMFDSELPLYLRGLSLFHIFLPALLLWLLHRLGYDHRSFRAQTLLAWVILPLTWLVTDPRKNIDWVFGPGSEPQDALPPLAYLGLVMVVFPVFVYWPTHFLLKRLFGRRGEAAGPEGFLRWFRGWRMPTAMLAVLVMLSGCTTTVIPPERARDPRRVAIVDYGRHASLVLPDGDGAVEFEYGEWEWFALGRDQSSRIAPALFWKTRGTLGRRALAYPPDPDVLQRLKQPEGVHAFYVPASRIVEVRSALEARFAAGRDNVVFNDDYGMYFVPDPVPYSAFHNCNHELALWLRELGCSLKGSAMFARFRVEPAER